MKKNFYKYILIIIIIFIFIYIMKSNIQESFENNCNESNCKSPNEWIRGYCNGPCKKGFVASLDLAGVCVQQDKNGKPLPSYTGSIRTPIVQC